MSGRTIRLDQQQEALRRAESRAMQAVLAAETALTEWEDRLARRNARGGALESKYRALAGRS
jgi:hypothetical protein